MSSSPHMITALVQGRDRPGIIAGITSFIHRNGGNIVYLDQHTDVIEERFFMRVQFDFRLSMARERLEETFGEVCRNLGMSCRLRYADQKKRLAVLVSRQGHCLADLLYRWQSGHLNVEIPLVISNHESQRGLAEYHGIPYHCLPITPESRGTQERAVLDLLAGERIDTVVLARYMQILSPEFVDSFPAAIINIHHSFLPAFVGANPYLQAFQRGVKIIGATSHYVTEKLDQGPIIAQDVVPVSHRDTVEDLKRKGEDMEKLVLARAVGLHCEDRVLVHEGKTIVFGD